MAKASIEQRPDGRWRARWSEYRGGPERSKHFPSQKAAKAFLVDVQHDLARGTYVTPEVAATSFTVYVDVYLERQVWRRATRANGLKSLRRATERWGDRPLATIRTADVQAYVASLTLAPSSIATEMKYVRGLFRMAVADGVLGRDPTVGVRLPQDMTGRVDPLTVEHVRQLEDAAGPWFRVAIVLGADLGLRQSELRGLGVDHVRFLRREVRIERQAQRRGAGFSDVKTRNSVRTIPVDASTLDVVAAHLDEHGASSDGLVLHRNGRRLAASTFEQAFRDTRERAGLPASARFHDLRHHCASELLGDGLSVVAVAGILGDTATTVLRTYGHLVRSDDDRVRASMQRRRLTVIDEIDVAR